jgi:hypothetical protein
VSVQWPWAIAASGRARAGIGKAIQRRQCRADRRDIILAAR